MHTAVTLRLVGGKNLNQGRVEVYYNSEWSTVCSDSWDANDAKVVCRQVGFPVEGARAYGVGYFEGESRSIMLNDIQCIGNESSLNQCSHGGWGMNNCSVQKVAGVSCCKYLTIRRCIRHFD